MRNKQGKGYSFCGKAHFNRMKHFLYLAQRAAEPLVLCSHRVSLVPIQPSIPLTVSLILSYFILRYGNKCSMNITLSLHPLIISVQHTLPYIHSSIKIVPFDSYSSQTGIIKAPSLNGQWSSTHKNLTKWLLIEISQLVHYKTGELNFYFETFSEKFL